MDTDSNNGFQAVDLDIYVDPAEWSPESRPLRYTHLMVERSESTEAGPYERLTDTSWTYAVLPKRAKMVPSSKNGPEVPIVGKAIRIRLDNQLDFEVRFSGEGPLSYAQAAVDIQEAIGGNGHCFVNRDNKLVIESSSNGLHARIEISGGAAPYLGFLDKPCATGKDPHITLRNGVYMYQLRDPYGHPLYWYRARLYNEQTRATSKPIATFQASDTRRIPHNELALGTVKLLTPSGSALADAEVVICPIDGGAKDGALVGGGTLQGKTNRDGVARFWLMRGYKVRVTIPSVSFCRELVVPDDDQFNLLDPELMDDLFAPRTVTIEYANRVNNARHR